MRKTQGYIAVGLSTALLILLPAAGTIGVGYAAIQWATPEDAHCGLWVFPFSLIIAVGALLGLAAGVGVGWLATLGLFRWANGCGLGEIRDDDFGNTAA
jgi:hypothetical protein